MNQDPQQPSSPQPEQPTQAGQQPVPVSEQPVAPQYAQPAQPLPVTSTTFPGKALGIASFVVSLIGGGLIALILGIVALRQSKAAGRTNGLALAGIIIGAVSMVAGILFIIVVAAAGSAISKNTVCTNSTAADGMVTKNCTLK